MQTSQRFAEFVRVVARDGIGDQDEEKVETACHKGLFGVFCCAAHSEVDGKGPGGLRVFQDLSEEVLARDTSMEAASIGCFARETRDLKRRGGKSLFAMRLCPNPGDDSALSRRAQDKEEASPDSPYSAASKSHSALPPDPSA